MRLPPKTRRTRTIYRFAHRRLLVLAVLTALSLLARWAVRRPPAAEGEDRQANATVIEMDGLLYNLYFLRASLDRATSQAEILAFAPSESRLLVRSQIKLIRTRRLWQQCTTVL